MKERIFEFMKNHGVCSAEFIADVLRWPLAEVQAELAGMERRGEIKSRTQVTYRLNVERE